MTVWLYDSMGVWLYDSMGVWLYDSILYGSIVVLCVLICSGE